MNKTSHKLLKAFNDVKTIGDVSDALWVLPIYNLKHLKKLLDEIIEHKEKEHSDKH